MRKNEFDSQYKTVTPDGVLNYIGVAEKYFDEINSAWTDETQDSYVSYYNNTIFPYVSQSMAIDEYTEADLDELIERVRKSKELSDSTVTSTIHHLVFDPYDKHIEKDGELKGKTVWGSPHRFKFGEDLEEALLVLKKSFTKKEQKMVRILLDDPCTDGERIGLAIMAYTGVRGNEACGLNFRDLTTSIEYELMEYLNIFTTTEHNSNRLKKGGKTVNSPRKLPVICALAELLHARMKYLAQVVDFPLVDRAGIEYRCVEDLPIVCKGATYQERCRSNDLSVAGAKFLRDELKMRENRVAGIGYYLKTEAAEENIVEADPTTYLFRRNFATNLKLTGLSDLYCRYYIGHALDDDLMKRSDFSDEDYLYEIWCALKKFPV